MTKVAVILNTYPRPNRVKDLQDILSSLKRQTYTKFSVCIIENSNNLKEVQSVINKIQLKQQVLIIQSESKRLSALFNIGWRAINSEYLGYIADDTVADKNWLREGVTTLSNSRQTAIVTGPVISTTYPASEMHRLYLITQKNRLIKILTRPFLYFIFDNNILKPGMMFESGAYSLGASLSASQKIKSRDIDLATTTSMIIRRSILIKLKGFDEKFTFNHADGDLFLRIKKCGYRIIFEPKMVVHHKVQIGPSRNPMIIGKDTALFYKRYLRPHSLKGYVGACLNIVTFIFYWVYTSVRSRNLKQLEGIKGFLTVYFTKDE